MEFEAEVWPEHLAHRVLRELSLPMMLHTQRQRHTIGALLAESTRATVRRLRGAGLHSHLVIREATRLIDMRAHTAGLAADEVQICGIFPHAVLCCGSHIHLSSAFINCLRRRRM